jgi:hypothetical protein
MFVTWLDKNTDVSFVLECLLDNYKTQKKPFTEKDTLSTVHERMCIGGKL